MNNSHLVRHQKNLDGGMFLEDPDERTRIFYVNLAVI